MAELTLGPWNRGLDNVSPDTQRAPGALADAVNVDIDKDGSLARRAGRTLALAGTGMHSLWSRRGRAYLVNGSGQLCSARLTSGTLTATPLHTLEVNLPLSFDCLNDDVIACSRREVLRIRAAGTVARLGPQDPGGLTVQALASGGLDAGRYLLACSYLRGDEESGLTVGAAATIVAGGGFSLALPQPTEGDVTAIRLYRTQPGGKTYFRVTDVPVGLTPYMLGATPLGREADNRFLRRLPGGQIIRAWRGYVVVARDDTLLVSQPLRYGVHDTRYDILPWPTRVRMLEPVASGLFVGDEQGVTFLRGERPSALERVATSGAPVVDGSGTSIEAAELGALGLNLNLRGDRFAVWLARNGYVLGSNDGQIIELQAQRITLPAAQTSGASVIANRRIVTAIQ